MARQCLAPPVKLASASNLSDPFGSSAAELALISQAQVPNASIGPFCPTERTGLESRRETHAARAPSTLRESPAAARAAKRQPG